MDKEWLIEQYVTQGKSTTDIGEEVGRDPKTVIYWLKKYDIPRRKVGSMSRQRVNKNRVEVMCFNCGKVFKKSPARVKRCKRHFCSPICGQIYNTGENNCNYKGDKIDQSGRHSFEYRKWREEVLLRDDYKCQKCGNLYDLHVHHLLSYAEYEELRLDIDNAVTLCRDCHYKEHSKMKR